MLVPRLAAAHAIDCLSETRRRRLRLAGSPRSLRSRRLSAGQRAVPRLHVGLSRRAIPASSCCTTRDCIRLARAACSSSGDSTTTAANSATTIRTRRATFAEYAVEGLGGPIYYFWSMLRVVMHTRADGGGAQSARRRGPATRVPRRGDRNDPPRRRAACDADAGARARGAHGVRRPRRRRCSLPRSARSRAEKRIDAIVRAFDRLARDGADVHLLLAGDASDYPALGRCVAASSHRAARARDRLRPGRDDRRLPGRRGRVPLPALADRTRNVGVVAAVPGRGTADGRSAISRTSPTFRRRADRLARVACDARPGRDPDRSAGRGRGAVAGDAAPRGRPRRCREQLGRRGLRVLVGAPHARRDDRRTTSACIADAATRPGAGRRWICRRTSPTTTPRNARADLPGVWDQIWTRSQPGRLNSRICVCASHA